MKLPNLIRFSVFFAAASLQLHAQPVTFTTFAGPAGGAGFTDGALSSARFRKPVGLTADKNGNFYVSELDNQTIRKISAAGVVTTLAGTPGIFGSTDGRGSAAQFTQPYGVAADGSGNVYVADTSNATIRKITPAGIVTTFAGLAGVRGNTDGTGTAARFQSPDGLTTDNSGNIYVADGSIRKITPAGVVTTIPGSSGGAIAVDSAGNVYTGTSETIQKITPAGGVTTIAGLAGAQGSTDGIGSAARFGGTVGLAIDSTGTLYAADVFNTIRKITQAGAVTTIAGFPLGIGAADGTGGAALFNDLNAVTIGIDGNIYAADMGNSVIRKITPAGVVTTFAGSLSGGGTANGTGSAARFFDPVGLALDGAGNLYVGDNGDNSIRKITPAAVETTLAGCAGCFGASIDGTGSDARFNHPAGVATDGSGNIYVADAGNNTIRKVTPAGVVTTYAGSSSASGSSDGTGSAARFNIPWGTATDGAGNLYVADRENHTIRKITTTQVVTTFAGTAGLSGSADGTGTAARFKTPYGLATDSGGNVYVADYGNNAVRKITPAGVVTTLAKNLSALTVAAGSGGNVYVAGTDYMVKKITPAGEVTTLGGAANVQGSDEGTGTFAHFLYVYGLAVDSAGNLYVADTNNQKIRIGRPGLSDAATIDYSSGTAGETRQLSTSPDSATSWKWTFIRQPSASAAALSSTSIRNPVFTPDVADVYVFQLTASDGVKTSITNVTLTATEPRQVDIRPRRRGTRH